MASSKKNCFFGWLAVFLLAIGLRGAMLLLVSGLMTFSKQYDIACSPVCICIFSIGNLIYFLGIAGLTVYTVLAFSNKRSNAVFLGRIVVIFHFLSACLICLETGDSDRLSTFFLQALLSFVVWFIYLYRSRQVIDLLPKEGRKVFKRDKYIVAILATILASLAIMAILLMHP